MDQASSGGSKTERKAYYHVRPRDLIGQAEAQLRAKQEDHAAQLRIREQLLRQVAPLESVSQQDSLAANMHRMILRSLSTQQATQAASQSPQATQQRSPQPFLVLEDIPLNLADFDDALLQRVSELHVDNCIQMYQSFVTRVQAAVTHVQCHGAESYLKQELSETVTRYGNLMMLHSFLPLTMQARYLKMNFITMQEEEAPPGWYARVAKLIPVHADFAALAEAGVSCAHNSVRREVDSSGDVMLELRELTQVQDPTPKPFGNLLHLDKLLDRANRCSNSVLLLRSMLAVYVFTGMIRFFESTVIGQAIAACWPYCPRGMLVFEEYLQRPDVQAVLQRNRDEIEVEQQGEVVRSVLLQQQEEERELGRREQVQVAEKGQEGGAAVQPSWVTEARLLSTLAMMAKAPSQAQGQAQQGQLGCSTQGSPSSQ